MESAAQPTTELPLSNCSISVTGVNAKEETKTEKIIKQLGGKLCKNLEKSVNCVLVKKVGTKKHEMAKKWKIPTLEFRWLDDCKRESKCLPFDDYDVRAFVGCVVTCTQLTATERIQIKRLVEENGGEYQPMLEKQKTTHLIAAHTVGEKYSHAKSWGTIKIVTAAWVENCATLKSWVPETQYTVFQGINDNVNIQAGNGNGIGNWTGQKDNCMIPSVEKSEATKEVQNASVVVTLASKNKDISKSDMGNIVQLSDLPALSSISSERSGVFRRDTFFISGFQPEARKKSLLCK